MSRADPNLKFTVEYKRTVRVQEYETLTIGVMCEFLRTEVGMQVALAQVREFVNTNIINELDRLRQGGN